jgi:hypothetical protein
MQEVVIPQEVLVGATDTTMSVPIPQPPIPQMPVPQPPIAQATPLPTMTFEAPKPQLSQQDINHIAKIQEYKKLHSREIILKSLGKIVGETRASELYDLA